VGCGGGDDSAPSGGPSCTQVSACGGDLVGEWKIADFCPDKNKVPDEIKQLCETATLDYDKANVSGTLSLKSDKTFALDSKASGTGYVVLGADCLKQSGGPTLTCKQVEEAINTNSKTQPVACASANGGCRCALSITDNGASTGTYEASGDNATLTNKDNSKLESTYCVKGSKLYMHLNLATGAMSGGMSYDLAGQLELEK
jgi:hypothetical protein